MKAYQTILATTLGVALFSAPAYATDARVERDAAYALPVGPVIGINTKPQLAELVVSADISVKPTKADGRAIYNPTGGVDVLEYMVDLNAVQTVKNEDATKPNSTFQAPVLGYELYVRATPANTPNGPRDDITLLRQQHTATPVEYLGNSVELSVTDENNTILGKFNKDGEWKIYTEGNMTVASASGPKTVALRSLHSGPSYDTLEIIGSQGTFVAYNDAQIGTWMNAGVEFTKGGINHPQWNHTFVPENEMVQYKAGKDWGRKWAVLGTPGFDEEKRTMNTPCGVPADCTPGYFEQHYLVGVDTETKGKRLIAEAPANETGFVPLPVGQIIASRYTGEKLNLGTYLVDAPVATGRDGTVSLEKKVIQIPGTAPLQLPEIEGVTGVMSVLYGYVSLGDTNHNGKIDDNELKCQPVAWRFTPVQFVPRGHEAEAYGLGVRTGLAIGIPVGYLIPHPVPAGTIGFGPGGNVVQ